MNEPVVIAVVVTAAVVCAVTLTWLQLTSVGRLRGKRRLLLSTIGVGASVLLIVSSVGLLLSVFS